MAKVVGERHPCGRRRRGYHSPTARKCLLWTVRWKEAGLGKYCIMDAPLWIEALLWKWVYCSANAQLVRLMQRDGSSCEGVAPQFPINHRGQMQWGSFITLAWQTLCLGQ
ncbi:hypothetical protein FB45DRAFT_743744 [Roridomyces roridus]|uniref:Uncharacterized protein n=1 Tax=Roridomyces roridus TaxID=1738132 RepID=A0AAD7FS29_9AGAR|nr:hypothetical protein FB45DRAFT_743744 [Roridomyces roridus]